LGVPVPVPIPTLAVPVPALTITAVTTLVLPFRTICTLRAITALFPGFLPIRCCRRTVRARAVWTIPAQFPFPVAPFPFPIAAAHSSRTGIHGLARGLFLHSSLGFALGGIHSPLPADGHLFPGGTIPVATTTTAATAATATAGIVPRLIITIPIRSLGHGWGFGGGTAGQKVILGHGRCGRIPGL
jgi:hypothetical protein